MWGWLRLQAMIREVGAKEFFRACHIVMQHQYVLVAIATVNAFMKYKTAVQKDYYTACRLWMKLPAEQRYGWVPRDLGHTGTPGPWVFS